MALAESSEQKLTCDAGVECRRLKGSGPALWPSGMGWFEEGRQKRGLP